MNILPNTLIKENKLMSLNDALQTIHFPENLEQALKAKQRLAFEELFILQLSTLSRKKEWESIAKGQIFKIDKFDNNLQKFLDKLPFELTNAQERAVKEIFSDLQSEKTNE